MSPPTIPLISIKPKFISDIEKAISLPTPAFAKKNIAVASLNPKPPIEIGNSVIAPMIGMNTKK
jgi:hypothetical protein